MIPKKEHKLTVIWLHGNGDNSENQRLYFTEPPYKMALPEVKYVILESPKMFPSYLGEHVKLRGW